jgi:hypothetical protein
VRLCAFRSDAMSVNLSRGFLPTQFDTCYGLEHSLDLVAVEYVDEPSKVGKTRDSERRKNLVDQDSSPCSRSFRYKFRSLIPRILAALRR